MAFTYFHCYMPETWAAQEACGLIEENAGVRFCESLTIRPDLKFNQLAAVDTPFYKMMEERRMPMYVDRLQGGCYFENYNYDWNLVRKYEELLGNKFLGFQMHEWVNNLLSDIRRIRECVGGKAWTPETICEEVSKKYNYGHLWLEAQSPEEHALSGNPETLEAFMSIYENLFKKRLELCRGRIVPCDSYALAYHMEINNGVKHFMPEVGAQTPDARIQIAYARGMARTNKAAFGVYYEPWGGEPFSACSYHRTGENEWGIKDGTYGPFETLGDNGGSSRSLQKRIQYYAYFSGAEFFSEEWGMCNTFYDWNDFELTPYGKVKYDFLQMIKKYPKEDIGTPYTPIAIVLPKDMPPLAEIDNTESTLWGYPIVGDMARRIRIVRMGLKELLSNPSDMIGSETRILINSDIPDAMDVIHEDSPVFYEDYQYFVNLTGNDAFEKMHKCCSVEETKTLLKELLPCEVEGGVHWFVNRTKTGWLLVVFNHSGVHRSVENGEFALPKGERRVRIRLKNNHKLMPLEGETKILLTNNRYEFTIPAGGWFLGRF